MTSTQEPAARYFSGREGAMFYASRELTELLEHLGFTRVTSDEAAGGVMASHRARKARARKTGPVPLEIETH